MGTGAKQMIWPVLLLGLTLRLFGLNQSLWLDEGINVLAVQNNSFFDLITQYARADFHPPGWFIVLWMWGKFFGYSEIAVRMPSVIFGILTIGTAYSIGRKLSDNESTHNLTVGVSSLDRTSSATGKPTTLQSGFFRDQSEKLGLLLALLIAVNPLHIYYSQEARMYSFATLAVAINFLLFIKLIKGEKIKAIYFILSNALVLTSDYLAYFIFPAQLIFLLSNSYKKFVIRWITSLLIAVLLGFWWMPIFLAQLDVGAVASANLPTWKFVVGGFDFKTLPLNLVKFIIGRITLADKFLYASLLIPVCSIFIFLSFRGVKAFNSEYRKLILICIFIPLIIATLISVFIPIFSYFRVLYVVPLFLLLIAKGVLSLKRNLKITFFSAVLMIEIFSALVYLSNNKYQREDWRGLVSFAKEQQPSLILFESSGILPPFDYYAKGSLNAKGALKDFPARDESAVSQLGVITQGNDRIFLIDYLVEISDKDRLVAKKLTQLGYYQKSTKDFIGVGFVYEYTK